MFHQALFWRSSVQRESGSNYVLTSTLLEVFCRENLFFKICFNKRSFSGVLQRERSSNNVSSSTLLKKFCKKGFKLCFNKHVLFWRGYVERKGLRLCLTERFFGRVLYIQRERGSNYISTSSLLGKFVLTITRLGELCKEKGVQVMFQNKSNKQHLVVQIYMNLQISFFAVNRDENKNSLKTSFKPINHNLNQIMINKFARQFLHV